MKIQCAVKSLAKKNIQSQTIDLPDWDSPNDLQSFLTQLVAQQVDAYHARLESANITASPNDSLPSNNLLNDTSPNDILSDYLELLTNTGKVSFGDKYQQKSVDVATATATALQAFEDGLFAVFVDDQQIERLQTTITINENSIVSLIRLTFLAGSYW